MERWLGRFAEICYSFMRIVVGLLFACHGAQKLLGAFGGSGAPSSPMITAAGVIELVGGGLMCVGFLAGYAAFICSGEMAVAYFMVHAPGGFWPIVNKGELAAVYSFVFLYIACKGAGRLSVDALVRKRGV